MRLTGGAGTDLRSTQYVESSSKRRAGPGGGGRRAEGGQKCRASSWERRDQINNDATEVGSGHWGLVRPGRRGRINTKDHVQKGRSSRRGREGERGRGGKLHTREPPARNSWCLRPPPLVSIRPINIPIKSRYGAQL